MPVGVTTVLTTVGVDAVTAGSIAAVAAPALTDAGIGAAAGGAIGDITGGGKGLTKGLEGGALGGLGLGAGGALGGALGGSTGAAIGDVLGGAAGGALGSGVTGGNIGTGALEGGAAGGLTAGVNALSGATGAPTNTASAGGGISGSGAGAAGTAAPAGSVTESDLGALPTDTGAAANAGGAGAAGGTPGAVAPSISAQVGQPSVPDAGAASAGANTGSTSMDQFINNLGGGNTTAQAAAPENLSSSVIQASNAATPGGTDPTLNQPSTLQNAVSSITGNPSSVAQGGSDSNISSTVGSATGGSGKGIGSGLTSAISDFSGGNIGKGLTDIAPSLVAAGGLGLDAIRGQQPVKGQNQVSQIANQDLQQGQTLESYLTSGTLPPGLQQAVTQAADSAKASIRSRYAAQGQSGSSAEQEDLAAVDSNAQAQGSQMALQLLNSGISETGAASQLFSNIMQTSLAQDQQLGNAIGSFATALSGGLPAGGIVRVGGGQGQVAF